MESISRRDLLRGLFGSVLTFTLVRGVDAAGAFSPAVKPIARKWIVRMEEATAAMRAKKITQAAWQKEIEGLLERVEMKDLLRAIDYERLARSAVFPEDHESADDVDFSKESGLPAELSFNPYFYAMSKDVAIVPHGHRNMASMHVILKGEAHGWHFERVSDDAEHLVLRPTEDLVLKPGQPTTVSDERDNVHWFKALTEPVFMFNIGVFKIDPQKDFSGRDYVDPRGAEKLSDGTLRARRIDVKEAYKLYGKNS